MLPLDEAEELVLGVKLESKPGPVAPRREELHPRNWVRDLLLRIERGQAPRGLQREELRRVRPRPVGAVRLSPELGEPLLAQVAVGVGGAGRLEGPPGVKVLVLLLGPWARRRLELVPHGAEDHRGLRTRQRVPPDPPSIERDEVYFPLPVQGQSLQGPPPLHERVRRNRCLSDRAVRPPDAVIRPVGVLHADAVAASGRIGDDPLERGARTGQGRGGDVDAPLALRGGDVGAAHEPGEPARDLLRLELPGHRDQDGLCHDPPPHLRAA